MQDEDVIRREFLAELEVLRRRIAEFEIQEARTRRWVELVQRVNVLKEDLLTRGSLDEKLKRITDGLVEIFSADFARIWITKPGDRCDSDCLHAKVTEGPHVCRRRDCCLHLMASSGRHTHIDGELHRRVPFDCYKIGLIASGAEPKFLTNDVANDPNIHNQGWVRELGLVSFAGYRLLSEDAKPIGVVALFSKSAFSPDEAAMLEGLANTSSQVVQAAMADEARRESENRYSRLVESTDTGFVELDASGRVVQANDPYARMAGASGAEELIGRSVLDWTAPECVIENDAAVQLCLTQGHIYDFETTYLRADGSRARILINATTEDSPEGLKIVTLCRNITERKKAEGAADRANQEWERTFNAISDLVMVLDDQHKILRANKAMADALGMTEQALIGRLCFELVHGEREPPVFCPHSQLLTDGEEHSAEVVEPRLGGIYDVRVSPLVGQNGQVIGSVHVTRDITERRRIEENLRDSESRLWDLYDNAPNAYFSVGADGLISQCNKGAEVLVGYSRDLLKGKPVLDLYADGPEGKEGAAKVFQKFIAGEQITNQELQMKKEDGSPTWVSLSVNALRDADGQVVESRSVVVDITERKQQENIKLARLRLMEFAAAHTLEELLQATLDEVEALTDSSIGFYHFVEPDQRTLWLQAWSTRTLREMCTAEGKGLHYDISEAGVWVDCVHERKPVIHNDYFALPHRKGMPAGHANVIRELVVPVFRGDRLVAVLGVGNKPMDYAVNDIETVSLLADLAWDIAERKLAERELQKSNDLLRAIIEAAPTAIIGLDLDGNVQMMWNPAAEKMLGWSAHEAMGHPLPSVPSVSQEEFRGFRERIRSGKTLDGVEVRRQKRDGTPIDYSIYASPLHDTEGRITGNICVLVDITERKQAEKEKEKLQAQLLQAQKMEAIGTLAGGIAHDFNNLLQVVLGYSDILLFDKKPSDPDYERLHAIRQAGRHGSELANRILAFSRRLEPNAHPVNLNNEIRRVQKMLQRTVPKMIRIEILLADNLMTVNADPGQMEQILLNLAVNAQHAMPDGGRLTVETANVTLDEDYSRTHLDAEPGEYVLLTVSDTGHGMDKEVVEHIFEPFYTTKGPGEGTGLGLAMVFGIVKSHKGHISCYSEPGTGTTFRIYLPAIVQEIEQDVPVTQQMPAFGTETILLVDDEKSIRKLGEQMLKMAGYRVLTATNGREALEVYRSNQAKIALVLLDLMMPEMGGKQCLEELLKINPRVKVVIASGYSPNGPTKEALTSGAKGFVNKPYDMRQVLAVVRAVLDEELERPQVPD